MSVTILYLVHPVGDTTICQGALWHYRDIAVSMAKHLSSPSVTYTVSPVECRVVEEDK
jgi:hypothetical protein